MTFPSNLVFSEDMKASLFAFLLIIAFGVGCERPAPKAANPASQTYSVTGVVQEVNHADKTLLIAHQAVPQYMPAMTMPFQVRDTNLLKGVRASDQIIFQLHVTGSDAWIDRFTHITNAVTASAPSKPETIDPQYTFTNEFGKSVNIADFTGQALAMTFFFTRCPIPNACPRLSQNFAEASQKLLAIPSAPTNWHFLSISIDPAFDTPEVLKAYAAKYNYDSNHWTFLTGSTNNLTNLTAIFGFDFKPDSGIFTHGFRTIIVNPSNQVQQIYPIGGNLSESIVKDILKALAPRTD